MGAQLGQVGGIGAEVGAAEALMAERAGLAVGVHVGGLLADAERHRHLADGVTEVLGLEQALDRRAGPFAAAVQLQRCELVDGFAFPFVGDPVVALCGREFRCGP